MKISEALLLGRDSLEKMGVSSSKLDSLILLAYALSFSKEQIIFNQSYVLDQTQQDLFWNLIKRRSSYEPVSHIIGKREFYGRDFIVNKDVLDPRPDSESLIELVIKNFPNKNNNLNILEIGCGSGCLIITLLKELENSKAIALDISKSALETCQKNIIFHEIEDRIKLLQSDLFEIFISMNIIRKFDLIISNPPYIESAEINNLQPEVRIFEPRIALDGGLDGLDFYRKIAINSQKFLNKNGKIIVEIGFGQSNKIKEIFAVNNFQFIESKFDLGGVERVLSFSLLGS